MSSPIQHDEVEQIARTLQPARRKRKMNVEEVEEPHVKHEEVEYFARTLQPARRKRKMNVEEVEEPHVKHEEVEYFARTLQPARSRRRIGAEEVERPPHPSTLTNTEWSKPEYTLPVPSLQFLFHLECDMETSHPIGDGGHGHRAKVIFKGGRFEGPRLRGTILGGYGERVTIQNTPATSSTPEIQTVHLKTRYNLLTDDNHCIYLRTTGVRTGEREILEGLGEEDKHGANEYKMRLNMTFECDDGGKYGWLNRMVGVASCGRNGDRVIYDAFEVV
ncbi:hypothetical protein NHQ30_008593 [Ciborinia camelliae]|nr:hypothetical protein NHQ30_008593 [Ciborinia camelliae]